MRSTPRRTHWAATLEVNRNLGVVDLRSGISLRLLGVIASDDTIFAQGNTISALDMTMSSSRGQRFYEWTLDVPTEPTKLRAWLDAVTNVKVVPGSDAVIWP